MPIFVPKTAFVTFFRKKLIFLGKYKILQYFKLILDCLNNELLFFFSLYITNSYGFLGCMVQWQNKSYYFLELMTQIMNFESNIFNCLTNLHIFFSFCPLVQYIQSDSYRYYCNSLGKKNFFCHLQGTIQEAQIQVFDHQPFAGCRTS